MTVKGDAHMRESLDLAPTIQTPIFTSLPGLAAAWLRFASPCREGRAGAMGFPAGAFENGVDKLDSTLEIHPRLYYWRRA